MDPIKKRGILEIINVLPIDNLVEHAYSKTVENFISLEEMIDYRLDKDKVEIVKNFKKRADDEAQKSASLAAAALANKAEFKKLCDDIIKGEYNVSEINNEIKKNPELEELLIESNSLSYEIIKKIKLYVPKEVNFSAWDTSQPLLPNRTDVFFFGVKGSGKSCVLASLFNYMDKEGLMPPNVENPIGLEYRNLLVNELKNGRLPESTAVQNVDKDGVVHTIMNYMPIELREIKNRDVIHPLNFIEMSGEMFQKASRTGESKELKQLFSCLGNDNKKLIFFVIDYHAHLANSDLQNQSVFTDFLGYLEKYNILSKTDGLYILLTKSDMFPAGVKKTQHAEDFIKSEYKNLRNATIDSKKRHRNKFKVFLFPYSIGEVKFGGLLLSPNFDSPRYIIQAIQKHSYIAKKTFFGKMF